MDKITEIWTMHTPKGSFDFAYGLGDEPTIGEKPVWVTNYKKTWDNPQDPIHHEFTLSDEKYVQDAFNWLYNAPANGIKMPPTEKDEL